MAPRARKTAGQGDIETAVVDAALAAAAARPWEQVTLAEIAAAAGVSLASLYPKLGSKAAILDAFARRIDRTVLTGDDPELLREPPRDRLFDVLMRRFEALAPFRLALRSIAAAQRRDPLSAVAQAPAFAQSMRWMVEAAGLDGTGLLGRIRSRGAALVFLAVLPTFLADEGEDLAKTMAALDRQLARGDRLMRRLPGFLRRGGGAIDLS